MSWSRMNRRLGRLEQAIAPKRRGTPYLFAARESEVESFKAEHRAEAHGGEACDCLSLFVTLEESLTINGEAA